MAKYFSTPSKSFPAQYSEEQNYHAGGERNSMERLLTEKNAVIESLQEQVNNAKEKLVRLMSAECAYDPPEWAVPPASSQASASALGLSPQGPSECYLDSQNDSKVIAQDSQNTSAPSLSVQSLKGPGKNTSFCPGQKEKVSDLKVSGHSHNSFSQKPPVEQSLDPERRNQEPMNPHQSLLPDGNSPVPQRQGQVKNLEKPPERLSQVNSVIREKLQEVLQDLGLGTEIPRSSLPCAQQPWKSSAVPSPQKMPLSKELGFSPYMVRRRRAAQRARSHFHGSASSYAGHRANSISGARGLSVHSRNSPSLGPQAAGSRVPRVHSRKPLLLTDPQTKPASVEGCMKGQDEPQGARGSPTPFPHQLSGSDLAPYSTTSPDLPEKRQLPGGLPLPSPSNYLDTESSSSDEFFCRCHRPYCEICFQSSSDSSDSDSSDTDLESTGGLASWEKLWARSKPIVNFKDDLKPTLV